MLEIADLTIQYQGNLQASVKNFNMTMKQGEIVCIVGESGSGKSSVLKAILGALPKQTVQTGRITFLGQEQATADKAWQAMRGTALALIFQDSAAALNPIRKIGSQFVEYIQQHEKISQAGAFEKACGLLEKVQLSDGPSIMNSFPHQLSGGMCQRVGIALALTFEPQLLLADEPTSALDVITQRQIVKELLTLRADFATSMIVVTHNLGLAAYLADQLLVMEEGQIVDSGPVLEVLTHPSCNYTRQLLSAVPKLPPRV